MLVFSCHADTCFYEHRLEKRPDGVVHGHLDNFAGVHAVMKAFFSGKMFKDHVRIELTYGEEDDFEGAEEVLRTLRKHDMVVVVDVTGAKTSKDFLFEKCKDAKVREFLKETLSGMEFEVHKGCPDPQSDEDEVDVYKEKVRTAFSLSIPVFGGDYNDGPVSCREQSIDAVAEAITRIADAFPRFCKEQDICES